MGTELVGTAAVQVCWLRMGRGWGGGGTWGGEEASNARHTLRAKLKALIYDILPSTTAVFSYATGSRKLSANEHFFCWRSNSSKFVTSNSDYIRRLFYN